MRRRSVGVAGLPAQDLPPQPGRFDSDYLHRFLVGPSLR